jgi:glycosyltransferase involved in cell wall biosynthesis
MVNQYYEESRRLIQSGRLEEVVQCLKMALKERPDNSQCWNETGTLLLRLQRTEDAIQCFLRCLDLPDCPPQVYKNLIHSYLSIGKPHYTFQWLKKGLEAGHLEQSTVVQVAECFEQSADTASSMNVLHEGKMKLEAIQTIQSHIKMLKNKRAKIAFFCGSDGPAFLRDIIEYTTERYPVRFFDGKTEQDVSALMQWSDISWFEWCTELARIGTHLPKVCRNIVRLHRYEAHLNWPKLINWNNVDTLVTVGNDWVIDAVNHWVGDIRQQTSVVTIPNGVDLKSIRYKPRKPGKNIAFVAKLRMVKNPMLLVQCMAELLKVDREYKLHMAGEMHDLLLCQYLKHMTTEFGIADAFVYDDWQDDIPAWLEDKNYIISTSVIESQGMGILEAMASGIKPIIHDFPGAKGTFGNRYLFRKPHEFACRVLEDSYNSEEYRQFVERRYPLDQQLLRINEIFSKFETQRPQAFDSGHQLMPKISRPVASVVPV